MSAFAIMRTPNEYNDGKGNSVKILGMTGLNFLSNEKEEYFVDSEILVSSEHDIILFKDNVRFRDDKGEKVSDSKGEAIIKTVLEILTHDNIKVMLL
jgi:hypothetical protein